MNRDIILKFVDFAKGSKIYKHLKINEYQSKLSVYQIKQLQINKLKNLCLYANANVPYYNNLFKRIKLDPEKIDSVQIIKDIPVLTRDIIQNHQEELISSYWKSHFKKIFKGSSSGTTGIPIRYLHDPDGESAGKAALYHLWSNFGWSFKLKGLHIWGNADSIKEWSKPASKIKRLMLKQKYWDASSLNNPEGVEKLARLLQKYQPHYLDGYSSSIYTLANYVETKNICIKPCMYVFTTAENLPPSHRDCIEKKLGKVIDFYGCGEINGIASQIPGSNKYYILGNHVLAETEPTGISGHNDLIVTDFDNFIMPFIRYKPGDMVDGIFEETNGLYPNQYFNQIIGRSADFIQFKNGQKMHPVTVLGGTFMRKFPEIKRHKVIWDNTILEFQFEVLAKVNEKEIEKAVSENLLPYPVTFKINYVNKILPGKNGKYKFLEIKNQT